MRKPNKIATTKKNLFIRAIICYSRCLVFRWPTKDFVTIFIYIQKFTIQCLVVVYNIYHSIDRI